MNNLHFLKYRLFVIHKKLDTEVEREHLQRFPDTFRLLRLKKLRLAVKDRLAGHVSLGLA